MKINVLVNRLNQAGLNLLTVLDTTALSGIRQASAGACDWGAIILVGNSGADMWHRMPVEYLGREHPVDDYALDTTRMALAEALPNEKWRVLFPATADGFFCPPLQQLGALAGWHHPSPLGTGINSVNGLWFAYRAAIGVVEEIPQYGIMATESPCLACVSQACLHACPATALAYQRTPDMKSCATYRLQPESHCEDTCLARLACPVATQMKYSDEQISHHYLRSIPVLKSWLKTLGDS